MRASCDGLAAGLRQLAGEVESSTAGWRGEAKRIFQGLWDEFYQDGVKVVEDLGAIAGLVHSTANDYQGQDEDSGADISGVVMNW